MAQREENNKNYTYLVIKHHSICEESKTPKDGFEAVEVFNPKTKESLTKYIDKWGAVTGYIVGIDAYDTGDAYETRYQGFKLNIDDEVIVDLPQKTPAYDAFCKMGENIDFTKPCTLSAYHNRTKDRTGFSIKQDGKNVEWKYTIGNMGDCPPWEKDEDGEWDSRKQRAFLKNKILTVVIPACNEARADRGIEFSGGDEGSYGQEEFAAAKAAPADAPASETPKSRRKAVEEIAEDEIPF